MQQTVYLLRLTRWQGKKCDRLLGVYDSARTAAYAAARSPERLKHGRNIREGHYWMADGSYSMFTIQPQPVLTQADVIAKRPSITL